MEEPFRPVSADSKLTKTGQVLRKRSLVGVVAVDGQLKAAAAVDVAVVADAVGCCDVENACQANCCAALHFHPVARHDSVMTLQAPEVASSSFPAAREHQWVEVAAAC